MTILTYVLGGVFETFTIRNLSDSPLLNLVFSQYFNFHPAGSGIGLNCGLSDFLNYGKGAGEITTFPKYGCGTPNLTPNGTVSGSLPISSWEVAPVATALSDLEEKRPLSDNMNVVGPEDVAGILQWDLGSLEPYQQISLTINENVGIVDEPGTLFLLASGFGMVMLARRRRPKASRNSGIGLNVYVACPVKG